MTQKPSRRGLNWLLPFAFALPFLAVIGYATAVYGEKIMDALTIALKLGVSP